MRLELFRLAPMGNIRVSTIQNGSGRLRCGSYQFAYRLINDVNGRNTKFSKFTPIVGISSVNPLGDQSGPVNTFANKSIELLVSTTQEERELYTSIEVGVLENTTGQTEITSAVSIMKGVPILGEVTKINYTSNERVNVLDRAEVVIDDAPIKTAKTLAVKNNRMTLGNLTYKDFVFDNGRPTVTSGEIITRKTPITGSTDKSAMENRGYFADEVYRFYVTFWDDYGDFSFPLPISMDAVTGNAISTSSAFQDMKFPKRDNSNKFIDIEQPGTNNEAVFALNRGVKIRVENIPSWAKGMSILRAKRKRNILFQSPLIPTTLIQSPDAQGDYPGEGRSAPSPLGIVAPKNMNLSLNKAITRRVPESPFTRTQVDWAANYTGFEFCKKIHVAYPPEVIMNNTGVPYLDYVKNSSLSIEAVDYCFLSSGNQNLFSRNESITAGNAHENDSDRSSSTTISAPRPYDYATNRMARLTFEQQIENSDRPVKDFVNSFNLVPAGLSALPIVGLAKNAPTSVFGAYDDMRMSPETPANGISPTNQRCVVITTQNDRPDPSYYSIAPGVVSGYNTSQVLTATDQNGSPVTIDPAFVKPVTGENSNPSWTVSNHFVEIVNFKIGLSDERYGNPTDQHDLVSTGASVTFDTTPQFVELEVFGGDCFISPFTFKVHDSHYGVVNSGRWGDSETGWGGEKFEVEGQELRRPMPYRAMGASIGVYLESEVNSLFSEEFTTKGNNEIYNPIIPNISPFSGSTIRGRFYTESGKFYRAMVTGSGIPSPGSFIDSTNRVTNIGHLFEDYGRDLSGVFYNYRRPIDVFYTDNSFTEAKSPLNYLYNPEYSFEDNSKPYPFIFNENEFNRTRFTARLAYSDTKILQTILDGFSRVRAANIYDLEESKGSLTKLIESQGRLYGIQEQGFCYIPFEANIIETADGAALAVQSGQIVGIPQYIDEYGSKYIRSVADTPAGVTFTDIDNSKIILFSGNVSHVNDLGVSKYIEEQSKALRGLKTADRDVQTYFDYNRDEVVYKFGNQAIVFDTKAGSCKTTLEPSDNVDWMYGFYNNSDHYFIGVNLENDNGANERVLLSRINSDKGNNDMLGSKFNSLFSFVINEKFYMNKMFYIVKFMAKNPETVRIQSFKNTELSSEHQAVTEPDRRAGFLLNKIRDESRGVRRVRGDYAVITSTLKDNEIASAITKLQASYRIL